MTKILVALLALHCFAILTAAKVSVPHWHPSVDKKVCVGCGSYTLPSGHPSVHDSLKSASGDFDGEGGDHPNIDTILQAGGDWEESDHPSVDAYMQWDNVPDPGYDWTSFGEWHCGIVHGSHRYYTVGYWHPNIDTALKNGEGLPSSHPNIDFGDALPSNHPDVMTLFRDGYTLPSWHPNIHMLPYVCDRPIWSSGAILGLTLGLIFVLAACVRWTMKLSKLAPCRMATNAFFDVVENKVLPTHSSSAKGNAEGGGIPNQAFAPKVIVQGAPATAADFPKPQSTAPKGASDVTIEMAAAPVAPETKKLAGLKFGSVGSGMGDQPANAVAHGISTNPNHLRVGLPAPALDMHSYQSAQKHAQHRADVMGLEDDPNAQNASPQGIPPPPAGWILPEHTPAEAEDPLEDLEPHMSGTQRLLRLRPKRNTIYHRIRRLMITYRIPKTALQLSTVVFVTFYMLLNVFCLVISGQSWERAWGSLAAANTMLLIIPATRNSILTWFLGLPFDHVIVFHRILGRIMILCATIHGLFYSYKFVLNVADRPTPYLTGLFAYLCCLIILLTTFDRVRRKCFQIFYWSHFSFLFMFGLVLAHCKEAQPFLGIGVGLYGLDRLLRILWTLMPRRTTVFHAKGSIAQVRFPKNPLTSTLGMHRLGQYYFVNFPRLSLTQWHPFSVSSGPREKDVEIHIRALGKHTKKIVEMARKKEEKAAKSGKNPWAWIRIDGPYGVHDFNCRRYPAVLLVGGGVGVTPVMGIMKDLYGVGNLSERRKNKRIPHCIETVYMMWIMPKMADFDCFSSEIQECLDRSRKNPHLPKLVLWIHCTREKGELPFPLTPGRPNFPSVFDQIQENHENKASLVFACGPSMVVHQIWDQCSKRAATRSARFDFHHEVFEF